MRCENVFIQHSWHLFVIFHHFDPPVIQKYQMPCSPINIRSQFYKFKTVGQSSYLAISTSQLPCVKACLSATNHFDQSRRFN
jgi:hypothetical protein